MGIKCKRFFAGFLMALILGLFSVSSLGFLDMTTVYARGGIEDFDDEEDEGDEEGDEYYNSDDDIEVGEWIKNRRGMTSENLNSASETLSPLVNMCGNVVGGIIVLVFAFVFIITGLDLLYISVPPIRGFLYKGDAGGQQGGGMMGGYGMRGGMMGGGQQGGQEKPTQWISDEAIQCTAMLGGGGQQGGGMMGGGMYGGGMGGMQGGQDQMSKKSVIGMYFKKRIFFMILLAICAIVLTSSVLLGTGVNLALWLTKMLNMINGNIPS